MACPQEWLASQLAQARRVAAVQKLVMPPPAGTAKNWAAYRAASSSRGASRPAWPSGGPTRPGCERAEQRYGVPAEVVVGIIGVETFYGRITGGYRIIDALATLAFDFPAGRQRPQRLFPWRTGGVLRAVRA